MYSHIYLIFADRQYNDMIGKYFIVSKIDTVKYKYYILGNCIIDEIKTKGYNISSGRCIEFFGRVKSWQI